MRCDIIIPVWNQAVFTRDCVDSILKNTGRVDYRVILVDNASDEKTKVYLEELASKNPGCFTLKRNDHNLGFVKAVNQGIAISTAPYLCLLNNDTVVTADWLGIMIDIAEKNSRIGIVNPSSNNLGQRPADGEPIDLYAEKLKTGRGKYVELGAAIGFCMLIKRAVIERIGLFDEIYGMGNFEDTDFSRRAISEGFLAVRACGAYVYHRENTSFSKVRTYEEDFRRNREIFEFRWGRLKRFAYVLENPDDNTLKRIQSEMLKKARTGNWVWCFTQKAYDAPHSNIRVVMLEGRNFYLDTVIRIITKKKKFDEIFVGGEGLARALNWIKFIHGARVGYY